MVEMTVLPAWAMPLRTWTTLRAVKESRPDVGSSQNMREGLERTSEAKDKRFISPPEIPFVFPGVPILVSWHLVRAICGEIAGNTED